MFLFKNHAQNEAGRLVPDLFLSRNLLNFDFLEKGLSIVSPPHFVYDFLRTFFLMLY